MRGGFLDDFGGSSPSSPGSQCGLPPGQLALAEAGARADASAIDHLSRQQLVGQRVILSYQGLDPPDALFEQIRQGKAAGAIADGTRMVMIANATYPALDPQRPASLSRPVITGELRQRLGFRGVTITDAIEAGGLEEFGPIPHRGVLAARAGADLLLFSAQEVDEGIGGYRELRQTYRGGSMSERFFKRSVCRVLRLRRALDAGRKLPPS